MHLKSSESSLLIIIFIFVLLKVYPPEDFCDATSVSRLLVKGVLNLKKKLSSSSILFKINQTTELFHFEFTPGPDKNTSHKYSGEIFSKAKFQGVMIITHVLTG